MKFHIIFSEYTPKDKHRTRKCWFGRCYSFSNRWFSGSKLILRSVWPYLPFCFCGVRGSLDRGCRMMAQTEMKTETSINSFSEEGVFFPGRGKVFFCLYRWDANIYIYQMTKMVLSNFGGMEFFISWVPYYCSYNQSQQIRSWQFDV